MDLVTANGRQFSADVRHAGPPTVVFETGLGAASEEWGAVVDKLPDGTGALWYDRLNRGERQRDVRRRRRRRRHTLADSRCSGPSCRPAR